jgi:hypothetical protein
MGEKSARHSAIEYEGLITCFFQGFALILLGEAIWAFTPLFYDPGTSRKRAMRVGDV